MNFFITSTLCFLAWNIGLILSLRTERTHRNSKFLNIFKVVTFPNDPCGAGGTRNGTCYTVGECEAKGGTNTGKCASGFGVCCLFKMNCGSTSSENCTYLSQPSITFVGRCSFKICRASPDICRIRLDFITFSLAGPVSGTTFSKAEGAISTAGGAIGDCTMDTFSLTSPGSLGSPIICGFNSGQHMIVDASDSCNLATFDIGSSGETRAWDIKVLQYECGSEAAGPPGCLQYFTAESGTIASYNFPTQSTSIAKSVTHLSSQSYSICIGQRKEKCAICYVPSIVPTTPTEDDQASFGLSFTRPDDAATSLLGQNCFHDYLLIPNVEVAPVILTNPITASPGRLCGRIFSTTDDSATTAPVCSRVRPFTIQFRTDHDEVTLEVAANADMANLNEQSLGPGGIIGFSLNYQQISC